MRIELVTTDGGIQVYCPYCQGFTDFAHMRNATWTDSKKCWLFDRRDEFALRQTLVNIFGTDDYAAAAKCDLRVDLDAFGTERLSRLFIAGREVARRRFADRHVDLGEGVAILHGGFPDDAHGCKLDTYEHTTLEVRDVPVLAAERLRAKRPEAVTILGEGGRDALTAERDYLRRRLDDLDRLLAANDEPEEEILADLVDEPDAASAGRGG